MLLKHLHLLYGYLVKLYKSLALWQSVIDKHSIDILHV